MRISPTLLSPTALRAVVEEFVTRDGTDHSLVERRIEMVLRQLDAGMSNCISTARPRPATSYRWRRTRLPTMGISSGANVRCPITAYGATVFRAAEAEVAHRLLRVHFP